MKGYIVTALILAISSCNPKDSDENTSDYQRLQKICAQFDEADRIMLDLINEIKSKHAENSKFLDRFNMEQVYWIQYRDTHLRALYPLDWNREYRKKFGKEVFNPCKCKELTRFTEQRIAELNLWLEKSPIPDQSECPSLWNQ
ncbi:MAG: lysozyme inhibitor LprI family protein [Bacteroidota bacterium]